MTNVTRHFILVAGGTGGHMLPAYATGAELLARGHAVTLLTNERGLRIPTMPSDMECIVTASASPSGGATRMVKALYQIAKGRKQAMAVIRECQPTALLAFGGYPAVPPTLAAHSLSIPIVIHEQNAIMGRANRFLAKKANAIALSYEETAHVPTSCQERTHFVGNPVREEIAELRKQPYPPLTEGGAIQLLVVGGSLGATILADVVPNALALLPTEVRQCFAVVQQCRAEDMQRVTALYESIGVAHECKVFIDDMAARLCQAHLFIGRAGASTLAEIACAGRPAILVPYPSAADDHQTANARALAQAGGARLIAQADFNAAVLARRLSNYARHPRLLEQAAERSLICGQPYSAQDLADLLESMGRAPLMDVIRPQSYSPNMERSAKLAPSP